MSYECNAPRDEVKSSVLLPLWAEVDLSVIGGEWRPHCAPMANNEHCTGSLNSYPMGHLCMLKGLLPYCLYFK